MNARLRLTLVAASLCAAVSPLAAQESSEDPTIVVTGRQQEEALERAKIFVNEVARTSNDQLARLKEPVCPAVSGLPEASATWLIGRVRKVAEEIGPGQAGEDCVPNLVVIVTDDVAVTYRDIKDHRRRWLAGLTDRQRSNLEKSTGPVIAWTATSLRNEDGQRVSEAFGPGNGGSDFDKFSRTLRVNSASFMRLTREQAIDGTVILIDRKALVDRATLQIADYVAVRGLIQGEPPESNATETILRAFSPGGESGPDSITPADYALVQALYSTSGDRSAVHERARIAKKVAEFDY